MAIRDLSVAHRYAHALFNSVRAKGQTAQVASDLGDISAAILSSHELASVLRHPFLGAAKKREVLSALFGGRVQTDVERFLDLVIEKRRADLIPEMYRDFVRLVDEENREADGEVVSAVPLSDAQRAALGQSLTQRFGVRVRLQERVDPAILGGLVLRVGDRLIDQSIATRLQRMSEQLKRTKVA